MKTIFCDIDGTLITHVNSGISAQVPPEMLSSSLLQYPDIGTGIWPGLLPGTLEKLNEWQRKGYRIILTTGRPVSMRAATERQLQSFGIFWDDLIMGLPNGQRVVINDLKAGVTTDDACLNVDRQTAAAFFIERNEGISKLDI